MSEDYANSESLPETGPHHVHGEAFQLMQYRADDGSETEWIWNSRDGVTPFIVTLRSGKSATHVDWRNDRYAPDHKPQPGDRIFVDLTPERARESAQRNAERFWDDPRYPAKRSFASKADLVDALVKDYLTPGAPDLVEIPEMYTIEESSAPKPGSLDARLKEAFEAGRQRGRWEGDMDAQNEWLNPPTDGPPSYDTWRRAMLPKGEQ